MTHVGRIPETQLVPAAQQLMSLCHQVKAVRSLRHSPENQNLTPKKWHLTSTCRTLQEKDNYQPTVVAAFTLADPGSEFKSCEIELRHRESFDVALRLNPNTTFSLQLQKNKQ